MTSRNSMRAVFIVAAGLFLGGCAVQPPHTIAESTRLLRAARRFLRCAGALWTCRRCRRCLSRD
jgi:hypothetical protein